MASKEDRKSGTRRELNNYSCQYLWTSTYSPLRDRSNVSKQGHPSEWTCGPSSFFFCVPVIQYRTCASFFYFQSQAHKKRTSFIYVFVKARAASESEASCTVRLFSSSSTQHWRSHIKEPRDSCVLYHLLQQAALLDDVSSELVLQQHVLITGVAFAEKAAVCLPRDTTTDILITTISMLCDHISLAGGLALSSTYKVVKSFGLIQEGCLLCTLCSLFCQVTCGLEETFVQEACCQNQGLWPISCFFLRHQPLYHCCTCAKEKKRTSERVKR